jgi:hypothetical protein
MVQWPLREAQKLLPRFPSLGANGLDGVGRSRAASRGSRVLGKNLEDAIRVTQPVLAAAA